MIDHIARRQAAQLLRRLAAGQITNREFEYQFPWGSRDPAIHEIFDDGAWHLYSDFPSYRLAGANRLDATSREHVARWVLFLETDFPYEWPVLTFLTRVGRALLYFCTLGMAGKWLDAQRRQQGDIEVWPFRRKADYEAALSSPPYLRGAV